MKELETIQRANKLNDVFAVDEPGPGGAYHLYQVSKHGTAFFDGEGNLHLDPEAMLLTVQFQHGPRNESDSTPGVLDVDLLEIVRDRLTDFQNGPFASQYNADALNHITAALIALNARTQERAERGVLGTNQK